MISILAAMDEVSASMIRIDIDTGSFSINYIKSL